MLYGTSKHLGVIVGGVQAPVALQLLRAHINHPGLTQSVRVRVKRGALLRPLARQVSAVVLADRETDVLTKEPLVYLGATRNDVAVHIALRDPPPGWRMPPLAALRPMLANTLPTPSPATKAGPLSTALNWRVGRG